MRKLDVLMMKSFLGPFFLTTAVSNFILLIQYLLKYFDDFVGKNLGFTVFAELLFYFSLNMLQIALPLGVLVASLMTFGNLGESFELTAIKGSGISLLRTLRPIFIFVCFLAIGAFFFNNHAIPAANLKAYSLLYDIKHTKPALDIKAGQFYNGIPDYSIKAKDKLPDGKTLLDVIIYDHTEGRGNRTVILADSSLMYTILDDRYLKLELYNGNYYSEEDDRDKKVDRFYRTKYQRMDMVFSLASFDLKRRKEELFQNNRQMKNIKELTADIDSFVFVINLARHNLVQNTNNNFDYHIKDKDRILDKHRLALDSVAKERNSKKGVVKSSLLPIEWFASQDTMRVKGLPERKFMRKTPKEEIEKGQATKARTKAGRPMLRGLGTDLKLDTVGWEFLEEKLAIRGKRGKKEIASSALNQARNIKVSMQSAESRVYRATKDRNLYIIEKYKKFAQALACIVMFMIGAPLGAIIKKGGLGVPTILAILFFIVYYVFTSIGEKSAKEGAMDPYFAVWLSNLVLLPFGLFFLRQARIDARVFELDIYLIWIEKLKTRFAKKNKEV